jgi:CPA1 family monovalent cation:H+ antiporter
VHHARQRAAEVGLAKLPQVASDLGAEEKIIERVRSDYLTHLDEIRGADGHGRTEQQRELERRLRLGILDHKRREITRLRNTNEIDDTVLRELQAALDIEELGLLGPVAPE